MFTGIINQKRIHLHFNKTLSAFNIPAKKSKHKKKRVKEGERQRYNYYHYSLLY